MLKTKPSGSEKKRKHSRSVERQNSHKRRSSESQLEDLKDELADSELDRVGSDIEEGGLNLSLPFQPIKDYIGNKQEMLDQCFHVLGEKKLRKMLPDELKECSLEEIKTLCWEQLEPIAEKNLTQILAGEEITTGSGDGGTLESQQDNVDSTSCLKETSKTEEGKHEGDGGGSGEEIDVLSINADAYDSEIEGPKEEQAVKAEEVAAADIVNAVGEQSDQASVKQATPETKKDIQIDIDQSVSEILAPPSTSSKDEAVEASSSAQQPAGIDVAVQGTASVCSIQQLELLELEMRARAIKALMKAGDKKKLCVTNNI